MTNNKKRRRSKFLAVDVWRVQFGPTSVRAIKDVYSSKFNISINDMNAKKVSLSDCINALRKLENPEYESPKDVGSY